MRQYLLSALAVVLVACGQRTPETAEPPGSDQAKPAVVISYPATGVSLEQDDLDVLGEASDDQGVVRLTYRLNGGAEREVRVGPGRKAGFGFKVAGLKPGDNLLTVSAYDAAGNFGTATVQVNRGNGGDAIKPVVSISSPANGATLSSSSVTVQGRATDNRAVSRLTYRLNGGPEQSLSISKSASVDFSFTASGLVAGGNTLTVNAYDAAGNVGSSSVGVVYSPPAPPPDGTAPTVSISSPANGATLSSSSVTVQGQASDNVAVTRMTYQLNGGAEQNLSITSAATLNFSFALGGLAAGANAVVVNAYDAAGNKGTAALSLTYTPPDTTNPTVGFTSPAAGATLSGTVSVAGTASDNVAVAKVELSVDGGAYRLAQGTANWSFTLDTTGLGNGAHTLTVRATDTSGNTASASLGVNVSNSTSLPPGVKEQLVTPEGVTIQIFSDVSGWTAQQIYDLLRPNAYELERVGPSLTVKVQTTYPSSTATSVSQSGGLYTGFRATLYLQAKAGYAFTDRPDAVLAHEYGHVWTLYHLYLSRQGDWSSYLNARGIAGDPRLDSSYNWSRTEMIADDYRMLFGTPTAIAQMAYINPDVADPREVSGLKDFFQNVWARP
ncbi:Ig-like domain-containing protein [Calidithermus chliarophilus]|uniref:Ig-like domain-containing protein n=1 Tax=Calidithermus chliarophilus TaxID=52023 RepID=UPI000423C334|nr:Ig-like domain-containing protein [Calidithermus chliarophilus]